MFVFWLVSIQKGLDIQYIRGNGFSQVSLVELVPFVVHGLKVVLADLWIDKWKNSRLRRASLMGFQNILQDIALINGRCLNVPSKLKYLSFCLKVPLLNEEQMCTKAVCRWIKRKPALLALNLSLPLCVVSYLIFWTIMKYKLLYEGTFFIGHGLLFHSK